VLRSRYATSRPPSNSKGTSPIREVLTLCRLTSALWRVEGGAQRRYADVVHQRAVRRQGPDTALVNSWRPRLYRRVHSVFSNSGITSFTFWTRPVLPSIQISDTGCSSRKQSVSNGYLGISGVDPRKAVTEAEITPPHLPNTFGLTT